MELEKILSDETLDGGAKAALVQAYLADQQEAARVALEKTKLAQAGRQSRFRTPLAVALTGLITLGGNFAFDWLRSEQDTGEALKIDEARGTREATAAEKAQQFELMKAELARFSVDGPETNIQRAESLLFLVRVGLLDGLNVDFLKTLADETIAVAQSAQKAADEAFVEQGAWTDGFGLPSSTLPWKAKPGPLTGGMSTPGNEDQILVPAPQVSQFVPYLAPAKTLSQ